MGSYRAIGYIFQRLNALFLSDLSGLNRACRKAGLREAAGRGHGGGPAQVLENSWA